MLTNDLILELITKTDTFKIEDKSLFIENVYLLVRQNSISCCRNVLKLGKLCHFTKLEWYKMFEYCKHKIYDPDEKIQILGYKICNQIIEEIEGKDLKIFGIFLYEKLDKSNDIILSKQLNTLTKIYEKNPFYDTKDLLLELGSILKLKNDDIKYSCINFMSVILKNQNCQNISKTEFMRISYDIMSYLSFWYLKKKHCGIVLLAQISDIIPPQELINIFLEFLESNDKNIKKGLIDGIAYLSNHVGLFNVLPVLLTDYKYVDDKVKLIIIRVLTKCKVTKRYLAYFNCIVEDSVVNPNINFRIEGIKLCTALLDQTDMDMEIITHYLNLVWFNILEKNILIQQEFNKYIKTFTKRFSSQFLLKYVIQGVFHPSKKVRQRYLEIYDILKKNDNNTDEYIKILCQKIY